MLVCDNIQAVKTCTICCTELPLSAYLNQGDRLTSACRDCLNERRRRKKYLAIFAEGVIKRCGAKACPKCSAIKPFAEFPSRKFRSGNTGCGPYCKDCQREYSRIKGNTPEVKRYMAEYRQSERGKAIMASSSQIYRINNRVAVNERKQLNKKARRAAAGYFTDTDIQNQLSRQFNLCLGCYQPFTADMPWTADHDIPITRGGDNWPSNILLMCRPCNSKKGAKTFAEFIDWKDERYALSISY